QRPQLATDQRARSPGENRGTIGFVAARHSRGPYRSDTRVSRARILRLIGSSRCRFGASIEGAVLERKHGTTLSRGGPGQVYDSDLKRRELRREARHRGASPCRTECRCAAGLSGVAEQNGRLVARLLVERFCPHAQRGRAGGLRRAKLHVLSVSHGGKLAR